MIINSKKFVALAARRGSRGLTLVEILVALVVLSVGLLGLAAMQTTSVKFTTSAYQRTQATALAYDLIDRMRGNRLAALNNDYNVAFQSPVPACGAFDGTGTLRDQDIKAWRNAMACRLPQSTGSVTRTNDEFTITIQWDDSQGIEAPLQFSLTTRL
ncbi:MAG: type IV pilus modification protein PilV [Woeseiaceae bacterium]